MRTNHLNILVLGSGAREHAIFEAIEASVLSEKVLVAPGNGGIPEGQRREIILTDHDAIIALCRREEIDMVICGPEGPYAAYLWNDLHRVGIPCLGPSGFCAQLEASKIFTKRLCIHEWVPTAEYLVANNFEEACEIIDLYPRFCVVKADWLAAGKGVLVSHSPNDAKAFAQHLFTEKPRGRILLEEKLSGPECSVFVLSDGNGFIDLGVARDYKRARDGDHGPNTGGMGGYSPLPDVNDAMLKCIKGEIITPILDALRKNGTPYQGFLYASIMLTGDGPKLIEFNVRLGDPEAQVILPRVASDILKYLVASLTPGGLASLLPIQFYERAAVCVVLASDGYPGKYEIGKVITGHDKARNKALVYHAGTEEVNGQLLTTGGRVMSLVGRGDTLKEARREVYTAVKLVPYDGKYHRTDIAAGL